MKRRIIAAILLLGLGGGVWLGATTLTTDKYKMAVVSFAADENLSIGRLSGCVITTREVIFIGEVRYHDGQGQRLRIYDEVYVLGTGCEEFGKEGQVADYLHVVLIAKDGSVQQIR